MKIHLGPSVFSSPHPSVSQRSSVAQGLRGLVPSEGKESEEEAGDLRHCSPPHDSYFHVPKGFSGSVYRSQEDLQSIGGCLARYSSRGKDLGLQFLVPVPSAASISQRQTHSLCFPS